MTSFIAGRGSGRSTSFIPAIPAARSVTTIAFIVHLLPTSFAICSRDVLPNAVRPYHGCLDPAAPADRCRRPSILGRGERRIANATGHEAHRRRLRPASDEKTLSVPPWIGEQRAQPKSSVR